MDTMEKPLTVKTKVLKEEECEISFSIEIPKDEVSKETDAVFKDIHARAALPGFRTGKAPMDMVKTQFADRARRAVLENLIGKSAAQVIQERKLRTIDTPKVEKIDFELGNALVFQMKVEKDPDIKAKDYKGIKITKTSNPVTDERVQKTLEEVRERNANLVTVENGKVEKTNFAVIDFDGKIDGKPLDGGSAKNYLLDMTQPQTISGFAEGLLGAAAGESRTVKVTFPADYAKKEIAGKQAVFDISVKEIKTKKMPALDEEFAKDLGLASLDELKKKVRENLEKEETARADKELEEQIYQALLDNNIFSVPPTLVEDRAVSLTRRAISQLSRQGLVQPNDPQAEKTLMEKSRPQAERDVRLSYLIKAIAAQEKLEAVEADVQALKKKALDESKDQSDNVEAYFKEHAHAIQVSLTEGKVLDFLKAGAKVKPAK